MNLDKRNFDAVPREEWNSWVAEIPDASYLHSATWIGFVSRLVQPSGHHSFAVVDETGRVVAICPLGISARVLHDIPFVEASWNGAPLGQPAIIPERAAQRRRLVREVFELFHHEVRRHAVGRSLLRRHPMLQSVMRGNGAPTDALQPLAVGYCAYTENTIVLDLTFPEDDLLAGMTGDHRKRLRRSARLGLTVREFRGTSPAVREIHEAYQRAHVQSAGRLTRPHESFDYMLRCVEQGEATIFAAFIRDTPISFLYCGEFDRFAFGWSQSNVEEYEEQYSPRHILEWGAILAYKQRGFRYYEVGSRWYGPQLHRLPTQKELSISFFKERYGGEMWPYLDFEKFFDAELCRRVLRSRVEAYVGEAFDRAASATLSPTVPV